MSKMDKTSHNTKLRGNDSKRFGAQFRSSDTDVVADSVVSESCSTSNLSSVQNNSMPGLSSKPHQSKCGGRGMIIQQLLEESKRNNTNDLMKNSKLDFSNTNIEEHFKKLQKENEKKLREKNEMEWKIKFNSKKHS